VTSYKSKKIDLILRTKKIILQNHLIKRKDELLDFSK
jgi:hypothetical protein